MGDSQARINRFRSRWGMVDIMTSSFHQLGPGRLFVIPPLYPTAREPCNLTCLKGWGWVIHFIPNLNPDPHHTTLDITRACAIGCKAGVLKIIAGKRASLALDV